MTAAGAGDKLSFEHDVTGVVPPGVGSGLAEVGALAGAAMIEKRTGVLVHRARQEAASAGGIGGAPASKSQSTPSNFAVPPFHAKVSGRWAGRRRGR